MTTKKSLDRTKFPKQIKVLGHRIAVELVDDEIVNEGEHEVLNEDDQGAYVERDQRIWIRLGMGPDATRETLLHEVVHAVDQGLGLDLSENKVNALGRGLLQVLRDNPGMIDLLTEG